MDISVIIPAYNEGSSVKILFDKLKEVLDRQERDYEIIFVDDGSTDNTYKVLSTIKDSCLKIIRFERNHGLTAALDIGFKCATGKILITMDADLQNDPEDITEFLLAIKKYDAVCGWRIHRKDPFLKVVTSKFANFVRNKLSGENIRDSACTFRIYRKEALDKVKLYEGMHRFLPTLLKIEGAKVGELEIKHHPRKYGKSKFGLMNRLWVPFIDLLAVIWLKRRKLNYQFQKSFEKTGSKS